MIFFVIFCGFMFGFVGVYLIIIFLFIMDGLFYNILSLVLLYFIVYKICVKYSNLEKRIIFFYVFVKGY